MSWVPSKKRFAQIAAVAICMGVASEAAAQVLVLRSLGPSRARFRPGTRLANDAAFQLRPGDSVVILARGRTRTFRGPGLYRANQPITRAQYAANYGNRRIATGAVRGEEIGPSPRPSDVWQVDVTSAGHACFVQGRSPVLWRPSPTGAVRLTITPQTGAPQTINWPAGQMTAQWPAAIPVTDGASYQFSWGANAPTTITAAVLNNVRAGDGDTLAATLLERDCQRQLGVFVAANPDPMDDQPGG